MQQEIVISNFLSNHIMQNTKYYNNTSCEYDIGR